MLEVVCVELTLPVKSGADAPLVQGAGVSPRGVERRLHRDREPQHRGALDLGKRGHLEVLDAMPPRAEVPLAIHEPVLPAREPALVDRWVDAELIEVELHQSEPDTVSQAEPSSSPDAIASQFALFVALVLATISVVEIATVRGSAPGREARRGAAKSRR